MNTIINNTLKLALGAILLCTTEGISAQTPAHINSNALSISQGTNNTIDPDKNKIIKTDRSDGRFASTRGSVQYVLRNLQPELAFNPKFTKQQFSAWQTSVRIKLRELMKFPDVPSQPEPTFISRNKRDGYVVEKWEFYPQPGSIVPFLMLIPDSDSNKNPTPAVVCMPGTNRSKEQLAGESEINPLLTANKYVEVNKMAMHYVKQGIVAIAVDNPGYGEVSDLGKYTGLVHDYGSFTQYLLNLNSHYMGHYVFQMDQLLKWVRTRPFVDSTRIALSGHSLGAWPAAFLGALNPDIKAVVFNQGIYRWADAARVRTKPDSTGLRTVAFGLFYIIPGLYKWFDIPDIIASIAPRSFLLTEGGSTIDINQIQTAYRVINAKDNIKVTHFEKFENPDLQYRGPLQEGLGFDEFWENVNVDPPNHYFKVDVAVPWLKKALSGK